MANEYLDLGIVRDNEQMSVSIVESQSKGYRITATAYEIERTETIRKVRIVFNYLQLIGQTYRKDTHLNFFINKEPLSSYEYTYNRYSKDSYNGRFSYNSSSKIWLASGDSSYSCSKGLTWDFCVCEIELPITQKELEIAMYSIYNGNPVEYDVCPTTGTNATKIKGILSFLPLPTLKMDNNSLSFEQDETINAAYIGEEKIYKKKMT